MSIYKTDKKDKLKILELLLNKSSKESINFYTEQIKISEVFLFENVTATFNGNESIEISENCFNQVLETLRIMLAACVNNELSIHDSIKKSLGFYWCQYLKNNNRKGLFYKKNQTGKSYWIGYDYMLFSSTEENPASWLYNDKLGNIILELTPSYKWFFDKPEAGEIFIKYLEWMKAYKPLLIRTISKETAKQWLNQIDKLIEVVKANDERIKCTGLGCLHCKKEGKTGCPCGS
jgi:hypothetical protein